MTNTSPGAPKSFLSAVFSDRVQPWFLGTLMGIIIPLFNTPSLVKVLSFFLWKPIEGDMVAPEFPTFAFGSLVFYFVASILTALFHIAGLYVRMGSHTIHTSDIFGYLVWITGPVFVFLIVPMYLVGTGAIIL